MEFLVAYDVATDTSQGQRRLRRVAKVCEAFGQRVQKSVFECVLTEAELEQLKHRLAKEIAAEEDSLRIYRLREPAAEHIQTLGVPKRYDIRKPLVM